MYTRIVFLMLSLSLNFLSAGVDPYLVRNLPKPTPELHKIKNIDFIYMINLDHRPEKFKSCSEQLNPYGIYPYRFSAIYGKDLSFSLVNDVGVKFEPWMKTGVMGTSYLDEATFEPFHDIVHVVGRNYFCHCMGRAPIAIVLSHLSVLQDAYDCGYGTIWVMEDDIEIKKDPNILSKYITNLDKITGGKWDILFTDQDTKNSKGEYVPCAGCAWRPNFTPENPERFATKADINKVFRKIGARYGAYSMIIRRSGVKKILNFIKKYNIFLPYDMEFYLPNDIKMYCVRDDVVSTMPRALSDNTL